MTTKLLSASDVSGTAAFLLDNKMINIEHMENERIITVSLNSAHNAISLSPLSVTLKPGALILGNAIPGAPGELNNPPPKLPII